MNPSKSVEDKIAEVIYGVGTVPKDTHLPDVEAIIRIIQEDVIGEDETVEPDYYEFTPEEFIRNDLRAEQRSTLSTKGETR